MVEVAVPAQWWSSRQSIPWPRFESDFVKSCRFPMKHLWIKRKPLWAICKSSTWSRLNKNCQSQFDVLTIGCVIPSRIFRKPSAQLSIVDVNRKSKSIFYIGKRLHFVNNWQLPTQQITFCQSFNKICYKMYFRRGRSCCSLKMSKKVVD